MTGGAIAPPAPLVLTPVYSTVLWSQIIDGKYYGVELPVYVREGASN